MANRRLERITSSFSGSCPSLNSKPYLLTLIASGLGAFVTGVINFKFIHMAHNSQTYPGCPPYHKPNSPPGEVQPVFTPEEIAKYSCPYITTKRQFYISVSLWIIFVVVFVYSLFKLVKGY